VVNAFVKVDCSHELQFLGATNLAAGDQSNF